MTPPRTPGQVAEEAWKRAFHGVPEDIDKVWETAAHAVLADANQRLGLSMMALKDANQRIAELEADLERERKCHAVVTKVVEAAMTIDPASVGKIDIAPPGS